MKDNTMSKELNTGKGKNRYKYQSFNALVENLKIDITYSVVKEHEPEGFGSFFYEALESWKELNLSTHFTIFVREVSKYCQSLPQIIYHKEKIIQILEKHLQVKDSLALEPLLDLVTKLSRDLEIDFYPFFERIVGAIIPLTRLRDVKILEPNNRGSLYNISVGVFFRKWCCLFYDLCNARNSYSIRLMAPLLGEEYQKPYVRRFAAEAFAFLLRHAHAENLAQIVNYIVDSFNESPTDIYCEGLSILCYEAIQSPNNELHPKATMLLKELLNASYKHSKNDVSIENNPGYRILIMTTIALIHHTKCEHFVPVWNLYLSEIEKELNYVIQDNTNENQSVPDTTVAKFGINLSLVYICLTVRKGSRVNDLKRVFDITKNLSQYVLTPSLVESNACNFLRQQFFKSCISLMMLSKLEDVLAGGKGILNKIFESNDVDAVLSFCLSLANLKWEHYTQFIFPHIVRFSSNHWKVASTKITIFLAHLLFTKTISISSGAVSAFITKEGLIKFPSVSTVVKCVEGDPGLKTSQNILDELISLITRDCDWASEVHKTSLLDIDSSLVQYLKFENSSIMPYLKRPLTHGFPCVLAQNLLGQAITTVTNLCRISSGSNRINHLMDIWNVIVDDILIVYCTNDVILRSVAEYMEYVRISKESAFLFDTRALEKIYPHLKCNIGSFVYHCRLYSLKILMLFDQFPLRSEETSKNEQEPCEIFAMAYKVEEIESSIVTYRNKTMILRKINALISTKRIPEFYSEVTPLFCFGLLSINFSAIWTEAINVLVNVAQNDPRTFWRLLHAEMSRLNEFKFAYSGFSTKALELYFNQNTDLLTTSTKFGGVSFDCPNLSKFNKAVNDAYKFIISNLVNSYITHFISICVPENVNFDHWNYYNLLIRTLTEVPHIAEQNSRQLVPFFLKYAETKYNVAAEDSVDDVMVDKESQEIGVTILSSQDSKSCEIMEADNEMKDDLAMIAEQSSKEIRSKMLLYLKLFSKFKNPRSVYKSTELQSIYLRLLMKGDIKIQGLALECLFTWKVKGVIPYESNLRNLVDEAKFRDELSTFSLNIENGSIEFEHRAEVMPIIIRILYGRVIARRGKSSSKTGMGARRIAVLSALVNCSQSELELLVNLLLEPFTVIRQQPDIIDNEFKFVPNIVVDKIVPYRKQLGYLNFLDDCLKQLGTYLFPFISDMLKVVLYMVNSAQRNLMVENEMQKDPLDNNIIIDGIETVNDIKDRKQQFKIIRQLGLKRINEFFKIRSSFNYQPYINAMFSSFISLRIPKLNIENTQAPSALMELFFTWASNKDYLLYLVDYNKEVLPKIFACLSAKRVRASVVSMVLDIIEHILKLCDNEMDIDDDLTQTENMNLINRVIRPNISSLLDNLEYGLLQYSQSGTFGRDTFSKREVSILSKIAEYVNNGKQAEKLVDLLLPYLRKLPRFVAEQTKAHILRIITKFLHVIPGFEPSNELFAKYYDHISKEFSMLRSRECRDLLIEVLEEFSKLENTLQEIVELVKDINSFSTVRLNEPDFERRLDAFNRINQKSYKIFSPMQWLPLLYNCIFFIQDPEELSIRNNSSYCVIRFIDSFVEHHNNVELNDVSASSDVRSKFQNILTKIIYPAIKKGVKLPIEVVRMEFLTILCYMIKKCSMLPQFADMSCLLFDDEEANFFNNIYHIQIHRRIRALKRFSNECAMGKLKSSNLVQIFLPLLGHFIFESDRINDHMLINETISSIGVITSQLKWGQYYAHLKQYMKLISRKSIIEKILIRTIITIFDNFHFDVSESVGEDSQSQSSYKSIEPESDSKSEKCDVSQPKEDDIITEDIEEEDDESNRQEESSNINIPSDETAGKVLSQRIHDTIIRQILPELKSYLSKCNDDNITVRIPVALAITKLLKALPEASLRLHLPGLLTTLCQILRSRSQDTRDVTRDTIVKISNLIGPMYFSFIVKELQGALTRGYQMHVLGFTLHSLLLNLAPNLTIGDIDYCLQLIVDIIINDMFGYVAEEKDAEEITGKLKEMKANKGFGTFEILAKIIHIKNIGILLMPLKDVMRETQSSKILRKVEETLQRVAIGLNNNPEFEIKEIITLCKGLVSQNLDILKSEPKVKNVKTNLEVNFAVQLKRDITEPVDHFDTNSYLFVQFGLTIFLSALKHEKFDIKSEEQLSMLDQFVNIVGNAMYSKHLSINILAIKIMHILCNLKLKSLNDALPVIVKQTFVLIRTSDSTNSELVQTCFKLLTIIMRVSNQVEIKENQLTFLINLIRPDLEEPQRQNTTFSLIKAIISRKLVVPEIYDLMQTISEIMITNQASQTCDLSRQVLFQFLLDYPQGRGRLKNQINFLIKNLDYIFESGRKSAMEMLSLIITKFGDEILMEYAEMFFIALSMSLVNDESNKCREIAGVLIKVLIKRMDEQRLKNTYILLGKWVSQPEKKCLQRMAVQIYGLVIEAFEDRFKKHIPELLNILDLALQSSSQVMEQLVDSSNDASDNQEDMMVDVDWEIGYYALNTFTKLIKAFPSVIYLEECNNIWILIERHILHSHSWIRLASSRLFGSYFANIDPETMIATGSDKRNDCLTKDRLRKLATSFCTQLKSEHLGQELAIQIVKNLFFIGKCFYYLSPDEDKVDNSFTKEKDGNHNEESISEDLDNENHDNIEADDVDDAGDASDTDDEKQNMQQIISNQTSDSSTVKTSLIWLFKKLSYQARFSSSNNEDIDHQRKSIYQWFAAMVTYMSPNDLVLPYLLHIISPIYRLINNETTKGQDIDNLKLLGKEVLDLVHKRIGTTQYHNAYNKVRQQIEEVRRERKHQRVIKMGEFNNNYNKYFLGYR
ncbi:3302_t:CDS:10 [Cetraspora pellucida]|uniref:3302_t:CDS:1 n=1 Tax=Cetraspora pellucida TaxID=1433469 RepID=A0A9N8VG54_9GLOM|nr:3302_t:CDS:10 [Cetraspora pellucida]